jgi:hypothetical protein
MGLIVSLPDPASAELVAQLPTLAPRVVAWAQRMEAESVRAGLPLTPALQQLARDVGVRDVARVRVVSVDRVPMPEEAPLRAAAMQAGLSQETASGITLGYAIYVRRGEGHDVRLLSHELRHVAQYESAGGIPAFLARHLEDLARVGYEDSPFEVDARAHERRSLPGPGA